MSVKRLKTDGINSSCGSEPCAFVPLGARRGLPAALERYILEFLDPADLSTMLQSSNSLQTLVHQFLSTTRSVIIPFACSAQGNLLRSAIRQHCKQLHSIRVFAPELGHSEWRRNFDDALTKLVAQNRSTLKQVSYDWCQQYNDLLATPRLGTAIVSCPNLETLAITYELEAGLDELTALFKTVSLREKLREIKLDVRCVRSNTSLIRTIFAQGKLSRLCLAD